MTRTLAMCQHRDATGTTPASRRSDRRRGAAVPRPGAIGGARRRRGARPDHPVTAGILRGWRWRSDFVRAAELFRADFRVQDVSLVVVANPEPRRAELD